jgi:hypothetical protein
MDKNNELSSTKDPDYELEEFWYSFKKSIHSFYSSKNIIYDKINTYSHILNSLKKEKKYLEIEIKIRDYMTEYAQVLIDNNSSIYYDQIFITNIKRWNRISYMFNFDNVINKEIIIFNIYFEIKNEPKFKEFCEKISINEIIKNNNFREIIIISIKNNKPKIMELLKKIPDYNLINDIRNIFPNIKFSDNIKLFKLSNILQKYIQN